MSARTWPAWIDVAPIVRAQGVVALPGSKSISIRALLLAALAEGTTELSGLLDSDDTTVMREALRKCGTVMHANAAGVLEVTGSARLPAPEADLFIGNSGLSARTLLATLPFMGGHYRLSGVARMHERPIADLVDALREVGARIRYLERDGFPPLEIEAVAVRSAREFSVRGDASSQFLTGLLQAAPLLSARNDVVVRVSGALISRPYVDLTLDMMRSFGVLVRGAAHDAAPEFVVPRGSRYQSPRRFAIEGDASSASYFLALGALAGGPVRVTGLGRASRQADVEFAAILERMGVTISSGPDWIEATSPGVAQGFRLRAIDADFNHMPDAAMTVALLAVFGDSDSVLRNIGSWRVKETDRLAAMSAELAKLGARVETGPDWLRVAPPAALRAASIETYDDHRIAMTFALAACAGLTLRINDPRCVAKTYPDYFEELARLARPVGVAA